MPKSNQIFNQDPTEEAQFQAAQPLNETFGSAAFGGVGWSQRVRTHRQEIGDLWADCGVDSEWRSLKSVLVHRPGQEMVISEDKVNELQFSEVPDLGRAQAEHDQLVQIYRDHGVEVHLLEVNPQMPPNQIYCADLCVMTPQGAILARPASTVRAGEERWVARTLGNLGIPVLRILTGTATFEGADLMWLDPTTAVVGRGLRTNQEAIDQISNVLAELGIKTLSYDFPYGSMHFMGMVRVVDNDLAVVWPRRTPHAFVSELYAKGYDVICLPDIDEAAYNSAFNFVVLGPKKILMAAKNLKSQAFYESKGIECILTPVDELRKANGAVGCMTAILHREMAIL